MRVMVTGATGYVGAHSVKALLDSGHKVRLLVRDPAKAAAVLGALGIRGRLDCVTGDMTDEAAVMQALKGCQSALHCAAVVTTDARRADEMMRANPRGAELVVGHAVRLGLDPVIYVSSVSALLRPGLAALTPDLPLGTLQSGYARSKAVAETYVRRWQEADAPVVITYPGSVTGPAAGSVLGEATSGVAANVKAGALPTHDAAWSIIDARDLGAMHAALMAPGGSPRRYVCGGHYLRMEELAGHLQALTGREFGIKSMSGGMLRGLARAVDALQHVVPFDTVFTEEAMVCFTQMPPADDSATLRELGLRWRPVRQTLRAAILAAHGAGLLEDAHLGRLLPSRRR